MKVRLYIRIRSSDGKRQYADPIYASNGKLKPLYARVDDRSEHHPEGVYHLRYLKGTKRAWESVGSDAQVAITKKLKRERFLDAREAGIAVVEDLDCSKPTGPSLAEIAAVYLEDIKHDKSPKTYKAYDLTLRLFLEVCQKSTLEEISRRDLLDFKRALQNKRNSSRTIANRLDYLKIFLTSRSVPWPLLKTDRVKYTEKAVSAYSQEEIRGLMAAADPDEAELIQFLLCTGVREQEATHATWRDLNLAAKTFKVEEKLDLGFVPKDREEGEVPIPEFLIELLKTRRLRHPGTRLIFPGPNGEPEGHFLRILKTIAFRAGMNCGECYNKAGKCCADGPTCSRFILHRFRKTFATMHHEAGISARTIQRWLRHSDLETTLRYLAGSDDQSEKTRAQVNQTFAGISDQTTFAAFPVALIGCPSTIATIPGS